MSSHAQALAEIHLKTGTLHLFQVEPIEGLGLSHFEHVAPASCPPLSEVVHVLLCVGLGVALHRGDGGRSNSLVVHGGGEQWG